MDHAADERIEDDERKMNDSTMPPPASKVTRPVVKMDLKNNSDKKSIVSRNNNQQRFGLAAWSNLLATANDLALRRGAPLRKIQWKEIRQHNTVYDGWMVIRNKVFFISPYLAYHPGGEAILAKSLGTDATSLYDKYHRWVNLEALIGKLQIGYLDVDGDDNEEEDNDDDDKPFGLPGNLTEQKR
jgi:cytochrome b involved in lipid metabolism